MLDWNEKHAHGLILEFLKADKVVLCSSDTVLGLFAQLSEKSKKKLDAIKKRNLKPYIILIQSVQYLNQFIDQSLDIAMQNIVDAYWPGPITIIFKAKSTLPDWMLSSQGTIAIRVPDHKGLQNVLQHVDGLFTTSANLSDRPLPDRYNQIDPVILQQVHAVCCDPNKIYDGTASTIVDFSSGSIHIIWAGTVVIDSI